MRKNKIHSFLPLIPIMIFIMFSSPLYSAMSVTSRVHILTVNPIVTLSLSQSDVIIMSEQSIDPLFVAGEHARIVYKEVSGSAGTLSYTLHNNLRPMALVASTSTPDLSIEFTLLGDIRTRKTIQLSKDPTPLLTDINNTFGTYSLTYKATNLDENSDDIFINFALIPSLKE